jgi:hypothetical protein
VGVSVVAAGHRESTGIFGGTYVQGGGAVIAKKGIQQASDSNCWGIVTSQADKNPKVLIKEIEVKRTKKVSYDG